jgi:hypothetical protein
MAPKKAKKPNRAAEIPKDEAAEILGDEAAEISDDEVQSRIVQAIEAGDDFDAQVISHPKFSKLVAELLEIFLQAQRPDKEVDALVDKSRGHADSMRSMRDRLVELLTEDGRCPSKDTVRANIVRVFAALPANFIGDDGRDALKKFIKERSAVVRTAVAKALPSLDPDLKSLLDDIASEVRVAAAQALEGQIILVEKKCFSDPEEMVRRAAFKLGPDAMEDLDAACRQAFIRSGHSNSNGRCRLIRSHHLGFCFCSAEGTTKATKSSL